MLNDVPQPFQGAVSPGRSPQPPQSPLVEVLATLHNVETSIAVILLYKRRLPDLQLRSPSLRVSSTSTSDLCAVDHHPNPNNRNRLSSA